MPCFINFGTYNKYESGGNAKVLWRFESSLRSTFLG